MSDQFTRRLAVHGRNSIRLHDLPGIVTLNGSHADFPLDAYRSLLPPLLYASAKSEKAHERELAQRGAQRLQAMVPAHDAIVIEITGPQAQVESIVCGQEPGEVTLTGPGAVSPPDGTLQTVIAVPSGTTVQITDQHAGEYRIGRLAGILFATLSSAATLQCEAVARVLAAFCGTSRGHFAAAPTTLLDVTACHSARCTVASGSTRYLSVRGRDMGWFAFGGTAENARLTAHPGTGLISVNRVTGQLNTAGDLNRMMVVSRPE